MNLLEGKQTPSEFQRRIRTVYPGLPKLNPGLELANTFGVGVSMRQVCYCRFNGLLSSVSSEAVEMAA